MRKNSKILKCDLVSWTNTVVKDKQLAKKVVDKLLYQLSYCLCLGYVVELRGFGTFEPVVRKGMENRRNPKTGETIEDVKPDRRTVKFRASKALEKEMNNE